MLDPSEIAVGQKSELVLQRSAPGPGLWDCLGYFRKIRRHGFMRMMTDLYHDYGDFVVVRSPAGQTLYFLADPAAIHSVLHTHAQKFIKGRSVEFFKLLVGDGLPVSDGREWTQQRRQLQPAFHRQHLESYPRIMASVAETHARAWIRAPGTIELNGAVARLTSDVVARSLFGADLGDGLALLQESWMEAMQFIVDRSYTVFKPPLFLPTPRNRRFRSAMATVNQFVDNIIQRRTADRGAATAGECDDLLSRLIRSRSEEGHEAVSTDRQIRDQILSFLFAGHETTANNILWTLSLILRHPEVRARIQEEIETVLGATGETVPITIDKLNELTCLRQVSYESLRLYPPVSMFVREAAEDVVISGVRIAKKSIIIISPFLVHRRADLWSEPERFDPSRFTEIPKRQNKPTHFLAFGSGPRACIGEQFAVLEALAVISGLLRNADLELLRAEEPRLIFRGTLCPDLIEVRVRPLRPLRPKGSAR